MRVRLLRWVRLFYIALFGYGTAVHVVQLAIDAYVGLPTVLTWFFTALVILDPLAAVLLWLRPTVGAVVGSAVLLADAAANGWANFVLDPADGMTPGRVAVVLVAGLGAVLAVLAARFSAWEARRESIREGR